ncbi:MAG: peptide chain release factor N(5)-glutamine methyltransferase [Chloroflexi bacterium]|nr:peptide chain release factor N(5)-glutamine methyltransferase [Ktedonobacteraceae bacterium]MBV9707384.1 peptide chain release factor N(5)-glutamine methyltransferase [Chloroflexota bacterium]
MTTFKELLVKGTQQLGEDRNACLDVQVLLEHVTGIERFVFYAYPESEVTIEQEQHFLALLKRRLQGTPVAYLVGHKEFYGLDFLVDKRVLIPRPETELLVEAALEVIRCRLAAGQVPIVADVGTGSGIIPVTLAVEEPRLPYLYASDISADALEVARLNCLRHHVAQRVRLLHGDLLAPLPERVDILTANLPYVGSNEIDILTTDVYDYEPHLALFSGPHGLDLLHRLLIAAQQFVILKEGAVVLLEIGYQQREELEQFLQQVWPQATVTFKKDYAGWDRLLLLQI